MKILLYADPHFCTNSSVIRGRGKRFSQRLENQIEVFKFINDTYIKEGCERCICLGDFFDRPDLSAEEITALKEIKTSIMNTSFIVGNHEAISGDLFFNSVNAFGEGITIYDKPTLEVIGDTQLVYIPYIVEANRPTITNILDDLKVVADKNIVILMHNDIKDIYYGKFKTTIGFDIKDIDSNCDICVNAHIHNGGKISDKLINLGSVTGLNFSNDASSWIPKVAILDTETLRLDLIDVDPALLFFKKEVNTLVEAQTVVAELSKYDKTKVVLSLKCNQLEYDAIKELVQSQEYLYCRINIDYTREVIDTKESTSSISLNVDYIDKFKEFVLKKYADENVSCKLMVEEINNIAGRS